MFIVFSRVLSVIWLCSQPASAAGEKKPADEAQTTVLPPFTEHWLQKHEQILEKTKLK